MASVSRRKSIILTLVGIGFVFAIGALLWMATNQRIYVWLAVGTAVLVLAMSLLGLRPPRPHAVASGATAAGKKRRDPAATASSPERTVGLVLHGGPVRHVFRL